MDANTEKILLWGLLGLVVVVLVFSLSGFFGGIGSGTGNGASNTAVNTKSSGSSDNSLGTGSSGSSNILNKGSGYETITLGTTGQGDVSIELTPLDITNGKLTFDFKSNTHSVDLAGFDLKKTTTLEYNGKVFQPASAPALNGHHVSGTLVFDVGNAINEIKNIKVTIKGVPQEEERVFEW